MELKGTMLTTMMKKIWPSTNRMTKAIAMHHRVSIIHLKHRAFMTHSSILRQRPTISSQDRLRRKMSFKIKSMTRKDKPQIRICLFWLWRRFLLHYQYPLEPLLYFGWARHCHHLHRMPLQIQLKRRNSTSLLNRGFWHPGLPGIPSGHALKTVEMVFKPLFEKKVHMRSTNFIHVI